MNKYVTPELPDVMLEGNEIVTNGSFKLQVIWTPGHSPGHICLYEREKKFILTGDHVLFDTTPHISFNPQSGPNPLSDYISSLQRLEQLEIRFVLPGHGPIFNALKLRIEKILDHHEQRKEAIMRSLRDGMKTAYEIAQQIPWMTEEGGVAFKDLGFWDKRLAISETIAHLKLLAEEGRVGSVEVDGRSLYLARE
jgi:glyoxylase-like metal-dependent hydrolase (beta-lactamase superfamily II)